MATENSGDPPQSAAPAEVEGRTTSAAPASASAKSFSARMLLGLLRILSGVPILSLFMGGMLFLVFSVTLKGRSVGLSAALLAGLLYCSAGYWNRQWFKKRRRRLYAVLLPISLALFLIPLILAPNGQGAPDGHVRNCYVGGHGTYPRYSPWNVVPEVDQVMAGMNLLALGDPYVDFEKGKRIRSLAMPLYETLEKDVGFESLGSVMGMAYCELFRMEFRTGHYYLFLPTASERAPSACLIYLHGMGGNRKSHFWVLSRIALQQNCAVIAPTFGLGNWDKPGGAALVIDVAHDALATLPIDPERMFLLGYSNGAKGVTRAVMKEPDLFRGLIYLSPVTEDDFFSSPEFLSHHESRKILFLHGGQDRRIPRDLVESTASLLRQQGCDVRIKVYDDEDHYLILSQSDAVTDEIIEWMSAP